MIKSALLGEGVHNLSRKLGVDSKKKLGGFILGTNVSRMRIKT